MLSSNRKFSHAKLLFRVGPRVKICRTEWKESTQSTEGEVSWHEVLIRVKNAYHERHPRLFKVFGYFNALVSVAVRQARRANGPEVDHHSGEVPGCESWPPTELSRPNPYGDTRSGFLILSG